MSITTALRALNETRAALRQGDWRGFTHEEAAEFTLSMARAYIRAAYAGEGPPQRLPPITPAEAAAYAPVVHRQSAPVGVWLRLEGAAFVPAHEEPAR